MGNPDRPINFTIQKSSPTEIEAIYIRLKKGKVSKSKEIGTKGEAVIDLDENGRVMGIEMLAPGRVTVKMFNKIREKYHIRELENFKINRLQEVFA